MTLRPQFNLNKERDPDHTIFVDITVNEKYLMEEKREATDIVNKVWIIIIHS